MGLIVKTTGIEEFLDPSGGSWVKALIMGSAGAGKTRSASFWPKPIFADCERGLMSVADRKVPYVEIRESKDMDALLEHLRQDGMKPPLKRAYQTLVIDTVDSYQRVLIQERLRAERKENLSGWADWGFLDAKMNQLIERMLNLSMNVVVNMHVKDERDEDGENSILVKKARLKGDIKDAIFQDFDLIGQMESSYVAEKGERVLKRQIRWQPEPRFPALRDRSGKLPRFTDIDFTEGDYQRVYDALISGIEELPETTTVGEVATEGDDAVVPGPDEKGGAVADPKLPAPKPAKKTAAKKTAAAKKAEPEPEAPAVTVSVDEPSEPAATTETEVVPEPSTDVEDPAVALLQEGLGAEVVEEEPDGSGISHVEVKPAKADKATTHCGDQPASMQKFPAVPGCGRPLTAENATKHQFALLRTKTYVCDDCFDHWKTNQAS